MSGRLNKALEKPRVQPVVFSDCPPSERGGTAVIRWFFFCRNRYMLAVQIQELADKTGQEIAGRAHVCPLGDVFTPGEPGTQK